MRSTLLVFGCLLLTAAPLRADWLNFRGPGGSGYAPEANPPAELGEDTLAWKVPLPGRGLGSPIVVGDRVFVSAASGPEQRQLHLLCFRASDGEPLWERRFWATGRTMAHSKTNVAAPSPASDGERVYALFSSNDLVATDLDGNLLWMRALTLDYPNASNSLGMASSPIVAGDTLVAQIENDSESFAAGFDLLTGANKWKLDRPKSANWTSPVVLESEGGWIAALQSSAGVLGVAASTGSALFDIPGGASTIPSSAVAAGRLYVPANGLTVYDLALDGSDPARAWSEPNQRPGTASPLVLGEHVYIVNNAGVLNCADIETGQRGWRIRLEGPFSSSPVAASEDRLYLFNEAGLGQVVDLAGEEGQVVSTYALEETILATPALSGDALYVRSDGHLWKFAAP